jgi:hypothetical protein
MKKKDININEDKLNIDYLNLDLEDCLVYPLDYLEITLLKMWIEIPNYSEISRQTRIPRGEVSKLVKAGLKRYQV